eukprot:COSAG02_NODE_948_length_15709_cov_67.728700_5_plen_101_part_00
MGLDKKPGAKQIAVFSGAECKEIVQQYYAKHDPTKPEADIDMVLAKPKYEKDFGKLCKGLEKKYKEQPVTLWWVAKHDGARSRAEGPSALSQGQGASSLT